MLQLLLLTDSSESEMEEPEAWGINHTNFTKKKQLLFSNFFWEPPKTKKKKIPIPGTTRKEKIPFPEPEKEKKKKRPISGTEKKKRKRATITPKTKKRKNVNPKTKKRTKQGKRSPNKNRVKKLFLLLHQWTRFFSTLKSPRLMFKIAMKKFIQKKKTENKFPCLASRS